MKKILLLAVLSNLLIAVRTSAQTSTVSHPAAPSPDNFSSVLASAPFRDPSLLNAARVDDLVSRMTLEEKVQQMMHAAPAIPRLGIPAYNWWSEGSMASLTPATRRSFRKRSAWQPASILTCFTPRLGSSLPSFARVQRRTAHERR